MPGTSVVTRLRNLCWELFHIFFRHYNFPCELGLYNIGRPGDNSPIFLSGNYTLVVDRLREVLRGTDCYLLVANSKGSNVWCAAGMNEFNEHDVIDALVVSRLDTLTSNRTIIAPPYGAPGIDVDTVYAETGFRVKWGPVHLNDLPEYIRNGYSRSESMTKVQFGLADRMEQALSTLTAYTLTLLPLVCVFPRYFVRTIGLVCLVFLFWFATWDAFPQERHRIKTLITMATLGASLACFGVVSHWAPQDVLRWQLILFGIVLLAAMDGCGSSVIYKTTVKSWLKRGDYRSLFDPIVDPNVCVGCLKCLHVCPKGVLARGLNNRAVAVAPDDCIECLACMKQCRQKALFNRSGRYKGDVKSIDGLHDIMTRSCSHLGDEDRWVGAQTEFRNGILEVVTASPAASAPPR